MEARVLQIVESVLAGAKVEDSRIELKSVWPTDHRRAARQIAGLANASGGEPVTWIIGVDEDRHQLSSPPPMEMATWWPRVEKCFSELAPTCESLVVAVPDGSVTMLHFDTTRTPYVVTTAGAGGVQQEVPWREGTNTRSAKRSEILRSLVEDAAVPSLELISARLRIGQRSAKDFYWELEVDAYAECTSPARLPEHKWRVDVRLNRIDLPDATYLRITGPTVPDDSPVSTNSFVFGQRTRPVGSIEYVASSGLHVNGSDTVQIRAGCEDQAVADDVPAIVSRAKKATVAVRLPVAGSSRTAQLDVSMHRSRLIEMGRLANPNRGEDRLAEFTNDGQQRPQLGAGDRGR